MCTTQEVLKTYSVGFLGAVAALLVGAAVWFAVFQPIDRPGLVWSATVYSSKREFSLYLKSKSLSYSTWLKRNPGIAPWEPGTRAANARRTGPVWDWKRDTLLAVIAALLATIAAALVARAPTHGEPVKRRAATREEDADRSSLAATATATCARAVGYVGLGAREATRVAIYQIREHRESQQVVWFASAVVLASAVGLLIARLSG